MSDQFPFSTGDDSTTAFASAYAEYARAPTNVVSAIVSSATVWHLQTPAIARRGVLSRQTRRDRRQARREEKQAQQACQRYVSQHVPQSLGLIGWIQIGLWLWRNRRLIADVIRLLREFLADRPAAFHAVMEGP